MADTIYSVGTLRYDQAGLIRVFTVTLIGWFVHSLTTTAYALSIPLLMEAQGASNAEIILISVSLAAVLNSILNPIISYSSDCTRSRFGRRRPYVLWAAPFMGLFFAMLPYAGAFRRYLEAKPGVVAFCHTLHLSPLTLAFGIITFLYYISFSFVATAPYYLIPDVIPKAVISRYYGLLRLAFSAGGMVFNYFLLRYLRGYSHILLPSIAVLFVLVTMITTYMVKEGDYPPLPPRRADSQNLVSRIWDNVSEYWRCCFGNRYVWLIQITFSLAGISFCLNTLMIFFCLDEIGMTLAEYGTANAMLGLVVLLILPMSWMLDKANHFRVFFYSWFAIALLCLLGFFFVQGYWTYLILMMLITLAGLPTSIDGIKVSIDLYPPGTYGQFSSSRAMFNSICIIIFSYIGGKLIDVLQQGCPKHGAGEGFWSVFGHYRALFLWRGLFMVAASLCFWKLYQIWLVKRRTGTVGERRTRTS
ncbi:MAG: MFS transporter [Victivallaceae bacterium]